MADYIDDDNLWKEDLFATLDVNPDTTDPELKKSYLKLAKKYHPDKFPEENAEKAEAQKLFSKITVAYNVLIDPQKKAHYLDLRRLLASHLPEGQQAPQPVAPTTDTNSSPTQNKDQKEEVRSPKISSEEVREQQARGLYDLAMAQMKKKKIDKAIDYFKQAIALKNDVAEFHSELGIAYRTKSWESMAQSEFKVALKFNPRDKVALTNATGLAKDKKSDEKKGGLFSNLFNFGKKK